MDVRTLPEAERELYQRLRRKYSLYFARETVGRYPTRVLMPADLEQLLGGRDPFSDVKSFPFWARLWESSIVLGTVLADLPVNPGTRLLELGAGLGLSGLAAAQAGYDVVLSDYEEEILDFQRVSAAANGLTTVRSLRFDWLDPPALDRFAVIAGAEILFRQEFVEPLVLICKNYLIPEGAVYLAHDVRRQSLAPFLRAASSHFEIGSRKMTLRRNGRDWDILVNRLRFKNSGK